MSTDAIMGSTAPLRDEIHARRGHRSRIEAARAMRAVVQGREIRESHRDGDSRGPEPCCIRCRPRKTAVAPALKADRNPFDDPNHAATPMLGNRKAVRAGLEAQP